MRTVKVGLVQMSSTDDPDDNLNKAVAHVEAAASRGARVICLPELFKSRYFCKVEDAALFDLAEPVPGPTTTTLEAVAADYDVTVIASVFEKRTEGLYHNTVAVLDGKRGYAGRYRKMHIPDDPLFLEKFFFAPGDLGFKVFTTPHARIGVLICWDQWYPEAARLTALAGADIIFYPTSIGWLPDERETLGDAQHDAWETVQRSHAITNGCFVAAVNRVGFEPSPEGTEHRPGIQFWGQSFIASPYGQVIERLSSDAEEVRVVDVDLDAIAAFRNEWPFLRDRRVDAYQDITRRFID